MEASLRRSRARSDSLAGVRLWVRARWDGVAECELVGDWAVTGWHTECRLGGDGVKGTAGEGGGRGGERDGAAF